MASTEIELVPLDPSLYAAFRENLLREYARDHVRAGQWTAADADRKAREETDRILPQGQATPGHFFFALRRRPAGDDVGRVWIALRTEGGPVEAFVYDLLVFEPFRGQGIGEAAMRALEPFARSHGATRIALHVFGSNAGAIRLYERIGYETTNRLMAKPLPPAP